MSDIDDKDVLRVRLRFLDLLKSFFDEAPDAEKLSRWRGVFSSLATESITPGLDASINRLRVLLDEKNLQSLQDEFYELFVNPYSDHTINTTGSFYRDGKNYGPSLVAFRQFLIDQDLIKDEESMENDDSLLLMLDFLHTLVEQEKTDPGGARGQQATFLEDFLLPAARSIEKSARQNDEAVFYEECLIFLNNYLDLEKGLLG